MKTPQDLSQLLLWLDGVGAYLVCLGPRLTLGQAGVEVPITIFRDGHTMELRIKSGARDRFLKGPSLH